MKTITNCIKPITASMFVLYSFCGCTKEVILNDLGNSFTYNPLRITSGITIGDVYNSKNFAAFTDITYYNNVWYIVFRVGTKHIGGLNGEIKVLKSNDAITWTVQDIIVNDTLDLRDPKFVIDSANNSLYLKYTGIKYETSSKKIFGFMALYSTTNQGWTKSQQITYDNTGEQFLFWRLTYSKGKMYSAAYRSPILGGYTTDNICLFNNKTNFETYASIGKLNLGKSPNEATIRFDESDNMYFLIRREAADVALGISTSADYTKVKWLEDPLSIRLSSPNFLFYNNKLLICGRDQDDSQFKFFSYNPITNKVEKKFTFPSGDETGYGGMSFNPDNKDELLISYYVINGERSYIKLIRINLNTFLQ
jgi:hypothetical protein